MTIDQKCDNYYISRKQRQSERDMGLDDRGTDGFSKCYSCDGNNRQCKLYSTLMDYGFIMAEFEEEEWTDLPK